MKTARPRTVLAGRYVLGEPIGRGDSGMVWRALDTVLDRTVAVKLIRPDLSDSPGFAERFAEAARAAASVHHPGLVPLLDVGAEDGVLYVVREHVEGESLRDRIARDGWPGRAEAASIAAQVREAREAARTAGLHHVDVKPENVLLEAGGRVRVTDAGLAEVVRGAPGPDEAPAGGGLLAMLEEIARQEPPAARVPTERSSWFRSWLLVPIAVVLVGAAAIAVGLSLGRLQVGGPLGVRLHQEESLPPPASTALPVAGVSAFDPLGDNVENDAGLPLVIDGDPATVWKSENYFDGQLHKPGVGVLIDLGKSRRVTGFRMETPSPGFSFTVAVGDDPQALVAAGGTEFVAGQDMRESLTPATGRYVLVWITTVVPVLDGNRAEIADLKVMGEA